MTLKKSYFIVQNDREIREKSMLSGSSLPFLQLNYDISAQEVNTTPSTHDFLQKE